MTLVLLLLASLCTIPAFAQSTGTDQTGTELRNLPWQRGPGTGSIATKAKITLGPNDAFLGEEGTRKFLVLNGNPPRDGHYTIAPTNDEFWFGVFGFDTSGYVRDDEKIDADALMASMKENNVQTNAERKKLGLHQLHLIGWYVPPHYDTQTKRLEWGTRLQNEAGEITVNYTVRLLGRTGVMSAVLVSDPTNLAADRNSFAKRLDGFEFNTGEKYSEFRQGDRVAEYGLAALIAGGAAAVATKKGFWAVLAGFFAAAWKFLAAAGVAVLVWLGSLFKKKNKT